MRLTKTKIEAAKNKGRYGDGRGLWLVVGPNGRKSWAFLYSIRKRHRHMGLGSIDFMTLDEARDRALELRRLVKRGIDPLAQLEAERAANQARLPAGERRVPTFDEVSELVRDIRIRKLTNEKTKAGWLSSMATYVYPHVKGVPVDQVTSSDFLKALEPISDAVPDTARKLRFKIINVLEHAASHDWIDEAKLAKIVRDVKKLDIKRRVQRHPSLPYDELPHFLLDLRQRPGFSARALEFLILTAGRSAEIRGARWCEIDLDGATWTIPAARMKTRAQEHKVPLSPQALQILRSLHREGDSDLVFPSATMAGQEMSDMTLLQLLRRMSRTDASVHGFRATFRTWVGEQTNYPSEVAEAALAHAIPNEVERAYKRTTFFEKRRDLMQAWGAYCDGSTEGNVVPLTAAA